MTKASALVADDDEDFRQALVELIELDGWQVWTAANGEEALHAAGKLNPDVLVLDQRMPRLTGTEVIQRLREQGNSVPVVFISAAYEIKDLASSVGINCHLRKPFGTSQLLHLMEQALKGGC